MDRNRKYCKTCGAMLWAGASEMSQCDGCHSGGIGLWLDYRTFIAKAKTNEEYRQRACERYPELEAELSAAEKDKEVTLPKEVLFRDFCRRPNHYIWTYMNKGEVTLFRRMTTPVRKVRLTVCKITIKSDVSQEE